MNETEYEIALKELLIKQDKERLELAKSFALANNPYKIGDIVTDHIGNVKVEQIQIDRYSKPPRCVYYGLELKKDGTPTKKMNRRNVWQTNINT